MTLTCSLFGHDFGEAEVVREREEDGSEVIITVREIKHCSRCSAERVVSENKEVTTVETPSDIVGEELAGESEEQTAGAAEGDDADADGDDDEPSDSDAEPTGTTGTTGNQTDGTPESAGVTGGVGGPTDGGGADAGGTAPGAAVPEAESPPPGSRDPEEDDGIILDDDEDEEEERAPGEWPEEDDEEDDWAPEIDPEEAEELDPDPGPDTVESTSEVLTVPEGSFHCPECSFSTPVEDSSLRAGDFCPECHRGTLEHRTE